MKSCSLVCAQGLQWDKDGGGDVAVPWDGQEPPIPSPWPVPMASTKAAASSGTANCESLVIPKGNRSTRHSPGPARPLLGLAQ